MNITSRTGFLLAFIASLGLIGTALYMQHVMHLEPCPLCIFQRVFVMAIGGVALLGTLHNPGRIGRALYAALIGLLSLGGGAVASRQVWLQHLPADQVPECGPSLDYMLEAFPLNQTLQLVFKGSGECAVVDWTLLGFSIAEWMLVVFAGFLIYAVILAGSRLFKTS
ncbi:MAG: disulfide bond formation protein B [Gammaproteobacteria bacterium]|nr:disulfide bond formation protein B [Gammaproteobacteria bacterium]MBU2477591.1 disulfide bond formation protein B [Gammaproteobacteria bacterium]